MACDNCGAEIPDGQNYCGKCGPKVKPAEPETAQSQPDKILLGNKIDDLVELALAEKVFFRVSKWFKLFAAVVGIPIFIVLLVISLLLGKKITDFYGLITTVNETITPIIEKAREDAELAQKTATDALKTSKELTGIVDQTHQQLAGLKTEVNKRLAELQQLNDDINKSKTELSNVAATATAQSKEIKAIGQQVKTVTTQKNVADIQRAYPAAFGERVASAARSIGEIDPSKKTDQDIYVTLNLDIPNRSKPGLDDAKVGEVMTALRAQKYTVFLGEVVLYAKAGGSSMGVAQFSQDSCRLLTTLKNAPCILYFRPTLKAKAIEVRDLARSAQVIPDERIIYVDPTKLEALMQELWQKSGVDLVVVLSG